MKYCKVSLCIDHVGANFTISPRERNNLIEKLKLDAPEIAEIVSDLDAVSSQVKVLLCAAHYENGPEGSAEHRSSIDFRFDQIESNAELSGYYEFFTGLTKHLSRLPDSVNVVLEIIRTNFNGDRLIGYSARFRVYGYGQTPEEAYKVACKAHTEFRDFIRSDTVRSLNLKF
jgi:hypothetical protein